jgi:hypothetical protein
MKNVLSRSETGRGAYLFIFLFTGWLAIGRPSAATMPHGMQLESSRLHPFLGFGRRVLSFVAPYVDLKSALQSAAYPPAEKPKGDDYKPGYYIAPAAAAAGGSGTS